MIRRYEPKLELVKEYAENVIIDRHRLIYNYREDVYNDFKKMYPDCNVSSHYFTRHINKIFHTKVQLVSENGNMVYIFVDADGLRIRNHIEL